MIKKLKIFEQENFDPYSEESWDDEGRTIKPIEWHLDNNIGLAYVGKLRIGEYFRPKIEAFLGRNYHLRVGFGDLSYVDEKFKTAQECREYIESWWYEFVDKICY